MHGPDTHRRPRPARTVVLVLVGVLLAGLLGTLLAGVGTASASQLGVAGTDGVASGVAVPTACSTADVSTTPVFVDDDPTGPMAGLDVTGIPATCADAWVVVTARDATAGVVLTGRAQHTGSGSVRVTGPAVPATDVVSVQVTIL